MNAIELNELSVKVAAALGLQAVTVNDRVRIFTGPESYFFLRDDRNRVEINGNFHLLAKQKSGQPTNQWFGKNSPTITVAASKSPEAITADIKRRFLPAYAAAFAEAEAQRNSHDSYLTSQEDLSASIQAAYGSKPGYPVRVEAHGHCATFTISALDRDNAVKLAAFLKTLNLEA